MKNLQDIQNLYNELCRKHNKLSVKVYFVKDVPYRGLYIEIPFRKIFLNEELYTNRTIYHEIFHHLNPELVDGEEFETKLDKFINNI